MSYAFFLEMAWKSALIAGAALALAALLRSRSAADRAAVLRVGVSLLLLLPLVSLFLPSLQVEAWSAPEAVMIAAVPSVVTEAPAAIATYAPMAAEDPTIWDDPSVLVLLAYLGGLAMVGLRLAAGLWTLQRWTRSAREVDCPTWLHALEGVQLRAGCTRELRLLVSDEVRSPLSWGWTRPVILIDRDTMEDPEDARAILAHEMAHIVRRDWPVLMLSRAAAALFWFNPLVWLLEREVVQQAEEAADCQAVDCVEPARYAQTLLNWAQYKNGAFPAHGIAPATSTLGRRIRAILDGEIRSRRQDSRIAVVAMLLCAGIAGPVAALELVEASPQSVTAQRSTAQAPRSAAERAPTSATAAAAPAFAEAVEGAVESAASRELALSTSREMAPAKVDIPGIHVPAFSVQVPEVHVPATPHSPEVRVSAVNVEVPEVRVAPMRVSVPTPPVPPIPTKGMKVPAPQQHAAPNRPVNPDTLIAMRIHGVDERFIQEMAAAGYSNLSPDTLIAMRIHGVTGAKARRATSLTGSRPSAEKLIAMTVHGVI
jgi:beta-lactamase regulating signal transducer with metallopeptidase domain